MATPLSSCGNMIRLADFGAAHFDGLTVQKTIMHAHNMGRIALPVPSRCRRCASGKRGELLFKTLMGILAGMAVLVLVPVVASAQRYHGGGSVAAKYR